MKGAKGNEAYCILGYRVPTTSMRARGEGVKGSEAYCILGFRVPTTSVGARDEGAKGSEGEQSILFTRF